MTREGRGKANGRSAGLQARLAAYSRYASTVMEQRLALEREDFERFSLLADARSEIQTELGAIEGTAPAVSLDPVDEEEVRHVRREMERAADADREIRLRLSALRAELAKQIRGASQGKEHARKYLEEEMGSQEVRRFDVRL